MLQSRSHTLAPKVPAAWRGLARVWPPDGFADALRQLVGEWEREPHTLQLRAICLLVADLIEQGWEFELGADRVSLKPPGLSTAPTSRASKSRTEFDAPSGPGAIASLAGRPRPGRRASAPGGWEHRVVADALLAHLDAAISEVRWEDLASAEEIAQPTERALFRLELAAAGAAQKRARELEEHFAANRSSRHLEVREASEDTDWKAASRDHLYVRSVPKCLARY